MAFDVFLCHNSQDKPEIREMALELQKKGLKPWLDEWELPPGQSWQELLEEQIEEIKSAAVFVGGSGLGPWQKREMRAFLSEFVDRGCPVIPVLLRNAPQQPKLPIFLKALTWVDFRQAETKPMERLIWGITRTKPSDFDSIQRFDKSPTKEIAEKKVVKDKGSSQAENQEQKEAPNTAVDLGNGIILEMVKIPGGSFLMGTEDKEVEKLCKQYDTDWFNCEKPQHKVTIKPFYMGKYPITQEQWRAIANRSDLKIEQDLDPNPAYFKDRPDSDRRPVETVNWQDAMEFCGRLSKLTGQDYRLPSEAEWEYACRAGTQTRYYFGDDKAQLGEYGWYGDNSGDNQLDSQNLWESDSKNYLESLRKNNCRTHPVRQKKPNPWGLYDLHGNVWEWCADYWHDNYENAPTDGRAWLAENGGNSSKIVMRGGSWYLNPRYCRSASRKYNDAGVRYVYNGFRVVCSASRTS